MIESHAGQPGGDATRHLRAAAHLDRAFRIDAIEELVENQYRIPAPTPGVDNALILEECLRARRAAVAASAAVIGIGVVGLLVSAGSVIMAAAVLILLGIAGALVMGLGSTFRPAGDSVVVRRRTMSAGLVVGVIVLVIGVPIFLLAQALSSLSNPLSSLSGGSTFSETGQSDAASGSSPVSGFGGAILVLLLWAAVGAVYRYQRQARLASLLRPANGSAVPGASFPALRNVFKRLRERSAEAETVYSGFNAFVGSGLEVRSEGWTFAVELRPSEQRRVDGIEPDPLETPDLHGQIAAGLADLGRGSLYPGDVLRRLSVRDRVFRSGMHATRPDAWYGKLSTIDPATGRQSLTQRWADVLDLGSHELLRHYLEARVELWESQIVASVFLRIHVQGGLLQMEGMPFVLPPVKEQYRVVDQVSSVDPVSDGIAATWKALVGLPRDVFGSIVEPMALVRSAVRTWSRQRWYERTLADGYAVDHGPHFSLRELGAEPRYQQRFQEVDVDRFFGSVRKRVATVVLDELKRRGYDVAEFEQFVQSININTGIQNYSSTVSGTQAAGAGSHATGRMTS